MAIDFFAAARGAQEAQRDAREAERHAWERAERERRWQESLWEREAAAYLAPLGRNQQIAADAGIGVLEFLPQQRDQIMADAAFQALSPDVQNRVLQQLQSRAVLEAQTAQRQGRLADANALMAAFGNQPVTSGVEAAAASGDVRQVVEALRSQLGFQGVYNADGTVSVPGYGNIPGAEFADQVIRSGFTGAGTFSAIARDMERARQSAAVSEQRERDDWNTMQGMIAAGFVRGADGFWRDPATGAVAPQAGSAPESPAPLPAPAPVMQQAVQPAGSAEQTGLNAVRAVQEQMRELQARTVQDPTAWLQDAASFGTAALAPAGLTAPARAINAIPAIGRLGSDAQARAALAAQSVQSALADVPRPDLGDSVVGRAIRALLSSVQQEPPPVAGSGLRQVSAEVAALRRLLAQNQARQQSIVTTPVERARLLQEADQIMQLIQERENGS